MRIAVIGSGIAGLTSAWALGGRHEVHVLEAQRAPGMQAQAVEVGAAVRAVVDVPLRVFYPAYYPTLLRLYAGAGLRAECVDASGSYTRLDAGRAHFRYRNLRLPGRSLPWVSPRTLASRKGLRILLDYGRFAREARRWSAAGHFPTTSLGDHLRSAGYSPAFTDGLLLPSFAAIATCSHDQARAYPVEVVARYFTDGFLFASVQRARGGATAVARALLARAASVRLGVAVAAVRPAASGVEVEVDGAKERFDHVVVATQANQAVRLVADALPAEAARLAEFRYEPVRVVMHTDPRLMPPDRRDWAPVNLLTTPAADRPMATIWVNAVLPALVGEAPVFQTVHPLREPAPEAVTSDARFERPLVDAASAEAWRRLEAATREAGRRVWFCGSYASPGVPLLESAAASALRAATAIDPGCTGV
ncbi:MAG: NAD(P)-binding protein [Vicinamibacteria bacterium]|nr:NAD(P)-binding protein [Vicinamibacteria bacterium]